MSWGPIDRDWGEGWEDFDSDPFADGADQRMGEMATVTRLPRRRIGRRGEDLDRSLTAPRPTRQWNHPLDGHEPADDTVADPRPRSHLHPVPDGSRDAGPGARTPRTPRTPRTAPTPRAGGRGRGGGGRRFGAVHPPGNWRNVLVKASLALLLIVVVGKLIEIQVLDRDTYVAVGEQQRVRTVELDAHRGRILDREGHDLALSVLRPTVFADPSQIDNPAVTAARLAPALGLDVVDLTERLSRDTQFVYVSRRITDDEVSAVAELGLDGVHIFEEPSRFTPSGDLAKSLIGDVAVDQVGSTGIEQIYDDVLAGTPGELTYERARDGGTIAAAGQSRVPAQPGGDVVLTIDRSLQYEAERALSAQVEAMAAAGGTVIVTRPKTGEILAMANVTRDGEGTIINAGANRAVLDVFEPGSVNKLITIAAALDEGLVEPESTLVVPWRYQVSDHQFTDDHQHPTVPMTVIDILAQSSNVGTIMLGQRLGKDRLDDYLRAFGFGERTALNFPNESPGILLHPDNYSGTSIGTVPIGQGIAVTALQMLNAYNVIANDGMYVEPRLVEATVDADGSRHIVPRGEQRRVVSAQTAAQVRAMLAEGVENGTGVRAQVPGYTVGGKTGTARKPQAGGGYRDAAGNFQYVAAFTGMIPAEDPELSMIVILDEPSNSIYGGTAAAPLFSDLAKFALSRFRIPPAAAAPGVLASEG